MKPGAKHPVVAVLLLLLALRLAPAVPAAATPLDRARFMGIDEVQPGMRGVGRTVLQGTSVVEFEVEILGTLQTGLPGSSMILARLSGADLEKTGVVAGMSGSPVLVGGRLLGALAFAWPFASEPIGGITPIETMLDLESRIAADPGAEMRSAGLPVDLWEGLWLAGGAEALKILAGEPGTPAADWSPIRVPVAVGGFAPGALGELGGLLEPYGMVPVQGGTSGTAEIGEARLEAGSAVGVQLVRGDASLAAIGTVTWVEGNRVLAFGHRMMNLGATSYPLTAARIVTVMPRLSSSFKVGVSGRTLGAVSGDFNAGILGELGAEPDLVPLTLELVHRDRRENLRFELLDSQVLTPILAGVMALNGMESLGRAGGASTVRLDTRVSLAGGRTVSVESIQAGFAPQVAFAGEVARLVGLLYGNPFEPVEIDGIEVTVNLEDRIEAAFLDRVTLPPGPYRAGEDLELAVRFRDYRGDAWSRPVPVTLPGEIPPGTYRLQVCDGVQAMHLDQERAPARYAPKNFEQMLELLESTLPYDRLVVRLVDEVPSPVVGGRELPRLPASLKSMVSSRADGGHTASASGTILLESQLDLDKVVLGCETLEIEIEPRSEPEPARRRTEERRP